MDLTTKYDWYTASDLANMVAISEYPGPVGINMATFAGYSVAGIPGAGGNLALTAPALIIIVIIARFLEISARILR